jgi:hypothetical protein
MDDDGAAERRLVFLSLLHTGSLSPKRSERVVAAHERCQLDAALGRSGSINGERAPDTGSGAYADRPRD